MLTKNIAVYAADTSLHSEAARLAQELKLPWIKYHDPGYHYLLLLTPNAMALRKMDGKSLPLIVDFSSKSLNYRSKNISLKNEALARAMGLKNRTQPKIIDGTGGLGRDSFIIAALGFEIEILERSPIIHALLKDGITRAKDHPAVKRMHLQHANTISWLATLKDQKPDIIYLDPMFPERNKSALSKQNMIIFHDIVGHDADSEVLLAAAFACATQRVVVKRPRLAPIIESAQTPSFSLKGRSSRFDVYIK